MGVKYRSSLAAVMSWLALTSWSNKDFETRTCFFFAGFVDLYLLHECATNDGAEETTIQCAQYVGMCINNRYYHHHNHLT